MIQTCEPFIRPGFKIMELLLVYQVSNRLFKLTETMTILKQHCATSYTQLCKYTNVL